MKVPWEVVCSQAVEKVLSDGSWAGLSCVVSSLPPIFLLKIHLGNWDVSNFPRTGGELFPLQSTLSCSLREAERFQLSEHFSKRLQQIIVSVRPPTTLVSAPTSNPIVLSLFHSCRTLFSQRCHCQSRPSILKNTCVFGLQSNKLLKRYWNGFGFLEIVLIHHTDQSTMLRMNKGYPSVLPLPNTHRLILSHPSRHRHRGGLSLCTRAHTSWSKEA